ncbi:MAG TPA: hypothetical protein DIC46_00440 [Porphyromonadaceae bacterium]|jgi:hypothetical protein|nr:hypothetical protein [Porphyromonadaceae bacterium]
MNERQPSLTHVEKWNDEIKKYTHITIDEAKEEYSGTISASTRIFRCYACGDYVSLTKEGIQERHFRHEHDESCRCPDKVGNNSASYTRECQEIRNNSRSLPFYLKTDQKGIWFEIGFFRLDRKSFHKYRNMKVRILTETGHILKTYWIRPENFGQVPITHIKIGSECSKKYMLEYLNTESNKIECNFSLAWGKEICGIDPCGTVFDGKSGKRIPDGACVEVEHQYWLFTKEQISQYNDVHICENTRLEIPIEWHLYQIVANTACQSAANFFRGYRLFLTGSPEKFTLLWPVCTQYLSEHIILYTGEGLSLLRYREQTERKEIFLGMSKAETEDAPGDQTKKLQFVDLPNCGAAYMPLVWIRRNEINQYVYLLKDPLQERAKKPEIRVLDQDGKILADDDYFSLPLGGKISVFASFNGFVEIWEDGFPVDRIEIKSKTETEHFPVHYGWKIRLYQGLDCIREICFQHKASEDVLCDLHMPDMELLIRLKRCKGKIVFLPHSIGCIALKMADYPRTKRWFSAAVRKQSIPEDALALLKGCFEE